MREGGRGPCAEGRVCGFPSPSAGNFSGLGLSSNEERPGPRSRCCKSPRTGSGHEHWRETHDQIHGKEPAWIITLGWGNLTVPRQNPRFARERVALGVTFHPNPTPPVFRTHHRQSVRQIGLLCITKLKYRKAGAKLVAPSVGYVDFCLWLGVLALEAVEGVAEMFVDRYEDCECSGDRA